MKSNCINSKFGRGPQKWRHYFPHVAYALGRVKQKLVQTLKLSEVKAADYDAVFYAGGHGPLWEVNHDVLRISVM